jgi:hypothetical protein
MKGRKGLRIQIFVSAFMLFIGLFFNGQVCAQIFNDSSHKYKIYVEPYLYSGEQGFQLP